MAPIEPGRRTAGAPGPERSPRGVVIPGHDCDNIGSIAHRLRPAVDGRGRIQGKVSADVSWTSQGAHPAGMSFDKGRVGAYQPLSRRVRTSSG